MRLQDLLHPERVIAFAARVFCGLLALLIIRELIGELISSFHFSSGDVLAFFALIAAASPIAYLIREHRRRARPLHRASRRGAERKPVLPPDRGGKDDDPLAS